MTNDLPQAIDAHIDGCPVTELDLLRYEVARSRAALLLLKTRLGPVALSELLREETARSTALFSRWVSASDGEFVGCTAELTVNGGTADGFLAWFARVSEASDEVALLGANPEHYLVQATQTGQEVIETLGGWGQPVRFYVDFSSDVTSYVSSRDLDDAYPFKMTGVGRVGKPEGGIAAGIVIHQLANRDTGFVAKLAIYLPRAASREMIDGHRTHLVLEFSNWINMYLKEQSEN